MIALFTSRSIFSRRSRNDSTRTVPRGVPCSPLPGNRIGFSEHRGGLSSIKLSNAEKLQAIVGVRVAGRRAGDQQSHRTRELMLRQPGPGEIAPALRIFDQSHWLDAT